MVSVIIIEDEYADETTFLPSQISHDTAGVYDIINTMIIGNEIAHKMKGEKDITEAEIEDNIVAYLGIIIENIKEEIMERLVHCEGCTCEKVNNKWIFNKTNDKERLTKEYNTTLEFIKHYEKTKIDFEKKLKNIEDNIKECEDYIKNDKAELEFFKSSKEIETKKYDKCLKLIEDYSNKANELKTKIDNL